MALDKGSADETGSVIVTFSIPFEAGATKAQLVGDFNKWSTTATPMTRSDGGGFQTSIVLPAGRSFRFRYLLDDQRWENDWMADRYAPNEYGGDDSVLDLTVVDNDASPVAGNASTQPAARKPKRGARPASARVRATRIDAAAQPIRTKGA